MKERQVYRDRAVVAHHESSEVPEPREGALDRPAPLVAPEHAAILRGVRWQFERWGTISKMPRRRSLWQRRVTVIVLVGNHGEGFVGTCALSWPNLQLLFLFRSRHVDGGTERDCRGTTKFFEPCLSPKDVGTALVVPSDECDELVGCARSWGGLLCYAHRGFTGGRPADEPTEARKRSLDRLRSVRDHTQSVPCALQRRCGTGKRAWLRNRQRLALYCGVGIASAPRLAVRTVVLHPRRDLPCHVVRNDSRSNRPAGDSSSLHASMPITSAQTTGTFPGEE